MSLLVEEERVFFVTWFTHVVDLSENELFNFSFVKPHPTPPGIIWGGGGHFLFLTFYESYWLNISTFFHCNPNEIPATEATYLPQSVSDLSFGIPCFQGFEILLPAHNVENSWYFTLYDCRSSAQQRCKGSAINFGAF